jgi:SAM-dependent methyltransferase
MKPFDRYFSGEALYGDDFDLEQISAWFRDEREGFSNLASGEDGVEYGVAYARNYGLHAFDEIHGYRHLPPGTIGLAVGLGAAFGHELRPVLERVQRLVIVEPAPVFRHTELDGVPIEYRLPRESGDLPVESSTVDLLTCFGVLHHIPNVSHVVREIARVIRPGGFALVREPIVSMGDWRLPRAGLTRRERGIPLQLFRDIIRSAGLETVRESLCMVPIVSRLSPAWGRSRVLVHLDALLSRTLAWNQRYHSTTLWQKVQPTNVFCVLRCAR